MRTASYSLTRQPAIPLTVLAGNPGAGKTSVIRHLLETRGRGRVVAVLRDHPHHGAQLRREPGLEHSATDVDAGAWITSHDPTDALMHLATREQRPDHVIVEVEGTDSPRRAGGYAYMPGYRPDGVVMVVDAEAAAHLDPDLPLSTAEREQLRVANLVVLNKLDLVGNRVAAATQRELRKLAPLARFLWCENGRVAPPLLLGPTPGQPTMDDWGVVAEWRPDFLPVDSRAEKTRVGEHCRSWCLVNDRSVDAREFRAWVNRLPETVLRGAGVVYLQEEPQHRYEFELIGARWHLIRGAPWGATQPVTRLNVVSLGGAQPRMRAQARTEPLAG